MSTFVEHRERLRRVPLLSKLGDRDLDTVRACLRWKTLDPGQVLFREREAGDTMVLVTEGSLVVSVLHTDGTEVELAQAGVGQLLGEMACLDPSPRSATVMALEPTVVAELSRDALTAMRSAAPALASLFIGEVIRVVTQRLRELEAKVDQELQTPTEEPPPKAVPGSAASKGTSSATGPAPALAATPRAGFLGWIDRLRGAG
ncbi:MAG: cyclic nucleotide-binding domain-containing protein [Deltaproteobacteria bacterium]|nr:cyclic nucleotide-binding domain-containing protein [Deltaproteobacteria bacterium]